MGGALSLVEQADDPWSIGSVQVQSRQENAAVDIGRIGIWSMELRFGDKGQSAEVAAELDALGYGAIWVPGGIGGDVTGDLDHLLESTRKIAIATGILNIWKHEPAEISDWFTALPADQRSRVMLGLGVSHGPLIGEAWAKPLTVMRTYVDGLEAGGISADHMCLAALGPKMLELAAARTAGAHPYLITPEHTALAREIMGPGKLLAPEQGVILESDPVKARELGRGAVEHYRRLPNYCNSWKRLGLTDEDIESASDHLIDAIFAWGGVEQVKTRVQAHFDAGADHVCLQVISGDKAMAAPIAAYRELAAALI